MEAPMRKILPLLIAALLLKSSAALAQAEMYDGMPKFSEGTDLGYYIWRDADRWHVRWTTKGYMRVFSGNVESVGGEVHKLKRIDVETEYKVLYPGRARHVYVGPRGRLRVAPGRAPVVASTEQDKIDKENDHTIVFNARTNDDIDGFDFTVDDKVTELRFSLHIGGNVAPNLIEVGKNNAHPRRDPLVVRLK
jgi:hypothetical protein